MEDLWWLLAKDKEDCALAHVAMDEAIFVQELDRVAYLQETLQYKVEREYWGALPVQEGAPLFHNALQ